jgi:uncharacterized membrane protein YfcA
LKRHRFDPASFIFGITFLALAVLATFTSYHVGVHRITWAGAGLLIAAGLAMVFGSRSRSKDEKR